MRFWFSNFRLKKAIQIFKPFCLFRNQRVVNRLLCQEKINGYGHYSNFKQIFSIGLGYKNFILNGKLYILVGDCNYIIFTVPTTSWIICKKTQIYILSSRFVVTNQFVKILQNVKRINLYKGKGLIRFKNFKFLKLKIGKKQRF